MLCESFNLELRTLFHALERWNSVQTVDSKIVGIRWDLGRCGFSARHLWLDMMLGFRPNRADTSIAGVEGPGMLMTDATRPEGPAHLSRPEVIDRSTLRVLKRNVLLRGPVAHADRHWICRPAGPESQTKFVAEIPTRLEPAPVQTGSHFH